MRRCWAFKLILICRIAFLFHQMSSSVLEQHVPQVFTSCICWKVSMGNPTKSKCAAVFESPQALTAAVRYGSKELKVSKMHFLPPYFNERALVFLFLVVLLLIPELLANSRCRDTYSLVTSHVRYPTVSLAVQSRRFRILKRVNELCVFSNQFESWILRAHTIEFCKQRTAQLSMDFKERFILRAIGTRVQHNASE